PGRRRRVGHRDRRRRQPAADHRAGHAHLIRRHRNTGCARPTDPLEALWHRGRPIIEVLLATAVSVVLIPVLVTLAHMVLLHLRPLLQTQVDTNPWFEFHPLQYVIIGCIAWLLGAMAILILILWPVSLLRRSDRGIAEF